MLTYVQVPILQISVHLYLFSATRNFNVLISNYMHSTNTFQLYIILPNTARWGAVLA